MATDKEKAHDKRVKADAVAWGRAWASAAQARVKANAKAKAAVKSK